MVQESKCKIAVIGGGPAGCASAYFLQNNCEVTLFDYGKILRTLLPTGGGRCNLAHAEFDFKELAKNYPRGEKFLYSVFSRFSTAETLEFFEKIGVETYIQDDMRIFPKSNCASDVRQKMIEALKQVEFVKEKVISVMRKNNSFILKTDKAEYLFDKIIIASGGHASYSIAKSLVHTIVEPKKALVGLKTKEDFSMLAGVSLKCHGEDLLFTHCGISGPYSYKISSIHARDEFPYSLHLDLCGQIDLQEMLNNNPHKSIKNLISELVPKSFAEYVIDMANISPDEKCHRIDGKMRDIILGSLTDFKITVTGTLEGGEVVTSGGIALNQVNSRTMESKLVSGLYFAGEVLDIDGFCGGFNLQNCWSTAYVAAQAVI